MKMRWLALILIVMTPACLLKESGAPRPFTDAWARQYERDQERHKAARGVVDASKTPSRGETKKPHAGLRLDGSGRPRVVVGNEDNGLSADVSAQDGGQVRLKHQWTW